MKNKTYLLNTLLAAITAAGLIAAVLVRTFQPAAILPELSIPNLVLISLVALVADYFLAPDAGRCYICTAVFSAITFGLLPLAAGLVAVAEAAKLALAGGLVFTAVTWLFSSMTARMATGNAGKAAAVAGALGIYLACQCFAGMFL